MGLLITFAILAAVCVVPVLLALACKAFESRALRQSNGQGSGNWIIQIHGLVYLWSLWGLWTVFHLDRVTPWLGIFGLFGMFFCCFFSMTLSLQEWHESRTNGRKKAPRQASRKGSLWDAELDH